MLFICPKCKGKLNITDNSAVCERGHSYDKSRFGYYNLLPPSGGGVHGDNREMVLARREFLATGAYAPLAERIAEIAEGLLPRGGILLDAGCGEGYYTSVMRDALEGKEHRIAAFDISKDAVKEAAKKKCADEYAVASSYHMPIPDESVDVLVNTFSPLAHEETLRVIRSGGYFIMAIVAEEHLFGLKSAIYDTPYKNKVDDTELSGFELIKKEELRYTLSLDEAKEIRSLFMMTPYAYRTGAVGRERVLSLKNLKTDAHFLILAYKKNG